VRVAQAGLTVPAVAGQLERGVRPQLATRIASASAARLLMLLPSA
jgi:hypothetical protein